jgi:hypothetical protein
MVMLVERPSRLLYPVPLPDGQDAESVKSAPSDVAKDPPRTQGQSKVTKRNARHATQSRTGRARSVAAFHSVFSEWH